MSCIGWSSSEEVFSSGDDHQVLKWQLLSNESQPLTKLPPDVFPTDMHWFPRAGKKLAGSDVFVLSSNDGMVFLLHWCYLQYTFYTYFTCPFFYPLVIDLHMDKADNVVIS